MRTKLRTGQHVAAVAGLAVALSLAWSSIASARPDQPGTSKPAGPCRVALSRDETVQTYERQVIVCAAARWTVPGGSKRAVCIARRESGLVPTATSPGGLYLGLFQHSAKMWPSRFKRWAAPSWHLGTSALNGRSNTIVTMRMVHAHHGWTAAGWPVGSC
jgi:hypothetical protein